MHESKGIDNPGLSKPVENADFFLLITDLSRQATRKRKF